MINTVIAMKWAGVIVKLIKLDKTINRVMPIEGTIIATTI
jgi:hypothetical protein